MADILRFPGNWQDHEYSEDKASIGSAIAQAIDTMLHSLRTKRLTINLQLEPDVAASNGHPDFRPAITLTLANAADRAPVGSIIDIYGSRCDASIEIEVSDLGDCSHIKVNNSMHRPYENDSVVQQSIRLPQGGTSTILRICRTLTEVADATEVGSNTSVNALRKAA